MLTDDNVSPQDEVIRCLRESKLDVLVLYLCSSEDEQNYCLHALETVSLMLREYAPDTLATASEQRSVTEKDKDMSVLMAAMEKEQSTKVKKAQSMFSARFNGVYSVKNMKSLSDNDYISHKFIANMDEVRFDEKKSGKRTPKNRLPAKEVSNTRRSTLNFRVYLKTFCGEFLKAYNKLMRAVKRELLRKSSDDHDDTYYLWGIHYFMRFNRLNEFQVAYVSETISLQMFHHIQSQITTYHEMMLSDKKKSKLWSKRMRLGVSAYKELLSTIHAMIRSKDEVLRSNADIIASKVFYVVEYREMLLSLFSHYDETKFSQAYLAELVESAHLFLKMLEIHSKMHSEILVQKKKRKVKRRKKKPVPSEPPADARDLDEQWTDLVLDLSPILQGGTIPEGITPFDGASEIPFEEQKVNAVYKIRRALVGKDHVQVVGLLRAARELWPEGDSFGTTGIKPEDELEVLKEIFMSNLEDPNETNTATQENDQEDDDEETDEEVEAESRMTEQKLELDDVYRKYASPKVVQPCCHLLSTYETNSSETNTCLVKFLHRIAWNCKMHAMFFQSTVFLTFQKIFQDPKVTCDPVIKELHRFARYIMGKFFEAARQNDKIYVEILFWKGSREAYELEEGYGASTEMSSALKRAWTEEEEEELRYLYDENKDVHIEGQDVADIIVANLDEKKRNKLQVIKALKRLGLIQSAKDLKPQLRKEWQESEITELQNLFEDHKGTDDIMGNILDGLSIKRSKKMVVDKLLELNLIQDRKEVRKKKSKKARKGDGRGSASESPDEEESDEDGDRQAETGHAESSDSDADEDFFRNLRETMNEDLSVPSNDSSVASLQKSKTSSQIESKKQLPKVWDESEIMELNHLFNENRELNNVMDVILSSLTVKRPKQSVIQKLLEIGLIKDKKELKKRKIRVSMQDFGKDDSSNHLGDDEVDDFSNDKFGSPISFNTSSLKKSKKGRILSDSSDDEAPSHSQKLKDILDDIDMNVLSETDTLETPMPKSSIDPKTRKKRPPKVWLEQEIVELQQLYEEHKTSPDVIGSIIPQLTVKRNKESIIEKLLEVRLIQDRKEIRKKRQAKADRIKKTQSENKDKKKHTTAMMSDDSDDVTLPLANMKRKTKENSLNLSNSSDHKKRGKKIWDEKEIIELQQLFEENSKKTDIIDVIKGLLSVKRSKESIIEKLLEVGLINNRKEIFKKKNMSQNFPGDSAPDTSNVESDVETKVAKKKKKIRILSDSSDNEESDLENLSILEHGKSSEDIVQPELNFSEITSKTKTKKKNRILSDSSENEESDVESQSTSLIGTDIVPKPYEMASPSDTIQSTASLIPSKFQADVQNIGDSMKLGQKRKRIASDSSENSDEDSIDNASKITGSQNDEEISDSNAISAQLQLVKKRARIIDSDESD